MAKLNTFETKLLIAVKEYRVWSKHNFPANLQGWDEAWNAVAKKIRVPVERCRTRWKSLKQTFQRALDRKRTTGKKSHWPYYDQMLFMVDSHHKTSKAIKRKMSVEVIDDESLQCTSEDEMEESQELPEPIEEPAEEPYEMPRVPESFRQSLNQTTQEVPAPISRAISVDSITKEEPQIVRSDTVQETSTEVESFTPIANRTNNVQPALYGRVTATNDDSRQEEFEDRSLSWRTIDTDEQFLLSCLTTMKRLSRRRNALVRLQIQKLMYEAEFADEDEAKNDATLDNR